MAADAALSSLLLILERRFFPDGGHAIDIHSNNKMPDGNFGTFFVYMLGFESEIKQFYTKLLDEEQQRLIILPQDIATLQEAYEMIQTKYREFEDQIRDSVYYQDEGSDERCNSDMLCPLRHFQAWLKSLQPLTYQLDFFIWRLNALMNETEPQLLKMITIREKTENIKVVGHLAATSSSETEIRREEDMVVGIEEEVRKIKHLVIGDTSSVLGIISIVGMGGIGKTTLASAIYKDHRVSRHFNVRIWITVSQIYDVHAVLLSLLIAGKEEYQQLNDEELGIKVYQNLKKRRYLIIVDDIWDSHVWDDIKKLLPNDDNGSRVVLTTRETSVAESAGSKICNVPLMDTDTSWNLLETRIFRGDNCPLELVDIGSEIAEKCHGLPLTIVVIAGLLRANKTRAWWENVANDVKSAIQQNDKHHVFDILSLSYIYLPDWLQPCLLYLGCFPEDKKISVSNLIKLWMGEGFLKPRGCNNLEETGYECLEDLIRRNLVSTTRKRRNGLPNKCFVHDIVREMCIKLSQGKFNPTRDIIFLSIGEVLYASYLSEYLKEGYEESHEEGYEFLRVLDVVMEEKDEFPCSVSQVCELANLRYLALRWFGDILFTIPANISMLTNLETLIIYPENNFGVHLPAEIWEIPKLRHLLIVGKGYLDYADSESEASLPLESLVTLLGIEIEISNVRILKRIPNIRKLGVRCIQIEHLVHLHHLEILHLRADPVEDYVWQQNNIFPNSLRKVKMEDVKLPWEYVGKILGSLPNLEVLKLKDDACQGREWETTEGHFLKLKMLEIEDSGLEIWRMESSSHFPQLEHLKLLYCGNLEELPWCMGEVETLELIEVVFSSKNVNEWAEVILEQQQDIGNKLFQLRRSLSQVGKQTAEGNFDRMRCVVELVNEGEFKATLIGGKEEI